MICLNNDSWILPIPSLILQVQNFAFKEVWFRKEATYQKLKTNLLRTFDGPISPPNVAQFGPRTPQN